MLNINKWCRCLCEVSWAETQQERRLNVSGTVESGHLAGKLKIWTKVKPVRGAGVRRGGRPRVKAHVGMSAHAHMLIRQKREKKRQTGKYEASSEPVPGRCPCLSAHVFDWQTPGYQTYSTFFRVMLTFLPLVSISIPEIHAYVADEKLAKWIQLQLQE